LDRPTLTESYRFGDPTYAREELRAELASLFIAAQTGIPHDPANHASYVGSWVEALRKDKSEIFRAAQDASAAADFVLALERERANSPTRNMAGSQPERESNRFVSRVEPGSGTVAVHDKRFGNDHHTPIDQEGRSSASSGRDGIANQSELSESFQEARMLATKALGEEARTYAAQTHSGTYCGKIIGETKHHLVQSVSSRTAIAHLKQLLENAPEMNRTVFISYRDDKTQVRELGERSRTAELAR
jgi:hypothetical protein